MRLRDGLRIVRRSETEVQVGTDPRWAVRITGLTPDEVVALLAADERGPGTTARRTSDPAREPPSGVRRPPSARRLGAGGRPESRGDDAQTADARPPRPGELPTHTDRLREICDQLVAAQLAEATTAGRAMRGTATADAHVWDLQDGSGQARVTARAQRTVGVLGLGPTGTTIAVTLAASGIGTVLVDDSRPVRSTDVGPCGYRWSDVGRERETVVTRMLRDTAPRVVVDGSQVPDLLVIVEHGATDPVRAADVLVTGVPHLSVVVREADVLVGPLVVDGGGPCLRCLDLHRADEDPAWPLVADALSRPAHDGDEVGVLAGSSASVAAAAVLAFLDRGEPLPATYEIGLPDAVPRRRDWAVHPSCGCTAQPAC
ncbi:MAG TPA: hypothetical protein VNR62_07665 [Cellulomonas sp.]|nr:hypothetical protein [Cellulomonas sp.]